MTKIQLIGTDKLDEDEKAMVSSVCEQCLPKLERDMKNIDKLNVHVKPHNIQGNKRRYEVKCRIEAPTNILEASSEEWDLSGAVHKCIDELKKQAQHKFHDKE
jgi:ribosome-associated translation inhibitor RaiA